MDISAKDLILGAGVLVTFLLGLWNAIANYRSSRRTTYINTVTSQRIQWIEQLRQDISAFSGLTHNWTWSQLEGSESEQRILEEIDKLRFLIRLRLNPAGLQDENIEKLIHMIPDLTHETQKVDLDDALEELTVATQKLLKEEWEKVKAETKRGG